MCENDLNSLPQKVYPSTDRGSTSFLLCRNYILHSCPRKGVSLILLVHFPGLWTKSVRHIVHITGLWHHRLKTVKLFLEPICVRFRVAKSPFFGAQFSSYQVYRYLAGCFGLISGRHCLRVRIVDGHKIPEDLQKIPYSN